jgi:hypothetical protein
MGRGKPNQLRHSYLFHLQFRARPMHSASRMRNYQHSTLRFLLGLGVALALTIFAFRLIRDHFMR